MNDYDVVKPRPILAKVREALFSSLGCRVEDASFLDLYAGTGRCGLEALKRGAGFAVFVEKNRVTAERLRKAIRELSFGQKAWVLNKDVFSAIRQLKERFDIIFLGPPYKDFLVNKTLEAISLHNILNLSGLVIAEHHKKEAVEDTIRPFVRAKEKRYGETTLSFYVYKDEQ
ncbi:16S rRNA (guanine(966)-N(2))-methyltransferase RsmD [bacterium]|nr:16S rRNA (guanine(966)-N(2))-methyltransferase RsmD [bacterium]MBU1599965.1 16S rRNA (guanine(966)-N(2))-methyltransferase RsmD [bacterium]